MVTSASVDVREIGDGAGIANLRATLRGELILPGDAAYETARRIWNGAIDRLFFHLWNFLQRQFALTAVGRSRFLVTLDELATEPAKDVVGDAGCIPNVGVLGEPAWLEALIGKFLHQPLERNSILQRN